MSRSKPSKLIATWLAFACSSLLISKPGTKSSNLTVKPLYFSTCSDFPMSLDETFEYIYDLDRLILIHHNAWFNCATTGVKPTMKRIGNIIQLIEEPVLRTIYGCNCYYTIIYEIKGIDRGTYGFEVDNQFSGESNFRFEINLPRSISGSVKIRQAPTIVPNKPPAPK